MTKLQVFLTFVSFLLLTGCGEKKPNVILVIVDALRADHLGCYGYERDTSPTLDSLAASGTLWTRVQAQAPWTLPACASILSGLTPRSHGAREDLGGRIPLPPEMPTVATLMLNGGYNTIAIVNCFWVGAELGFDKDFQRFRYYEEGNGRAEQSVDELISELERAGNDKPYFALLHLYDVHAPYDPPEHYLRYWALNDRSRRANWNIDLETGVLHDRERCQDYINRYDGEIRWTDDQLGRLFAWLRETGAVNETVVIVTSDHGEEFLDHGWIEHSTTLYQELLDVPLIISGPDIPVGIRESTLVGQIDILPTIIEIASLGAPDHLEGYSLLSPDGQPLRILPSSGTTPNHWHPEGRRNRNWVAVRQDNKKLIWYADEDSAVVYNLDTDPDEQVALPVDSMLLESALLYWATPRLFAPAEALNLNRETVEMLRGLGYL